ncbi:MAG: hypothetical protein NCW75_07860 [Phycisphaera sp.]|nr:MAG: hypothetical protein NCW75_07860 [Phycisphaera sp.]
MRSVPALLALSILVLPAVGQSPCEPQRLQPPAFARYGEFGYRVEMNQRHLLIADWRGGAACVPPGSCVHGEVNAYERDSFTGLWIHRQTITLASIEPGDFFGFDMDLDGDRLLVGAIGSDLAGANLGAAFVFDFDGDRWVETGTLLPVRDVQGFGQFVALSGDWAMVEQFNLVELYELAGGSWVHRQTIVPEEPGVALDFGTVVAMDGEWLMIGAAQDRGEVIQGGAVYVYRLGPDGLVTPYQTLRPVTPDRIQYHFGQALAIEGGTLAVGAPADARGAVHIYNLVGGRWELATRLAFEGADTLTNLGWSVDLSGDTLVAGATEEGTPLSGGAGHVYRRGGGDVWREIYVAKPPFPSSGFGFGSGTDGRYAVFGADDEPRGSETDPVGAAHIYDLGCLLCAPDLDADGTLTIFDFLTFLNLFQDGDPIADFDGDGELTIFDFLAFQTAFDAGCS